MIVHVNSIVIVIRLSLHYLRWELFDIYRPIEYVGWFHLSLIFLVAKTGETTTNKYKFAMILITLIMFELDR